jgi:four helix bundle protein
LGKVIPIAIGREIGKLNTLPENFQMTEKELKLRTRRFAINVLNFVDNLPRSRSGNIIANQLGRSASSVAANNRAACRGRSHAEFLAKIGIVEEEADESTFWLDIIPDTKNGTLSETTPLLCEARELTAIFTAASKTAKQNKK